MFAPETIFGVGMIVTAIVGFIVSLMFDTQAVTDEELQCVS